MTCCEHKSRRNTFQEGEKDEEQDSIMGGLIISQPAFVRLRDRCGGAGDIDRQRGSADCGSGKFSGSR